MAVSMEKVEEVLNMKREELMRKKKLYIKSERMG